MLRRLVLACGGISLLAGMVLIVSMDIAAWMRLFAAAGWLLMVAWELRCQAMAYARISRLRIDSSGTVFGTTPDGESQLLHVRPGSMVLSKMAWLVLRFSDGSTYGELLIERYCSEPGWRGLMMMSNSRRGAFGGNQRS